MVLRSNDELVLTWLRFENSWIVCSAIWWLIWVWQQWTYKRSLLEAELLSKHWSRLDLRLYFFSERVVSTCNCLDDQCVSATTLNSFKSNQTRLRSRSMGLFMDNDVPSPRLTGTMLCWYFYHSIDNYLYCASTDSASSGALSGALIPYSMTINDWENLEFVHGNGKFLKHRSLIWSSEISLFSDHVIDMWS